MKFILFLKGLGMEIKKFFEIRAKMNQKGRGFLTPALGEPGVKEC